MGRILSSKREFEISLIKGDRIDKTQLRFSAYSAKKLAEVWRDTHDRTYVVKVKCPTGELHEYQGMAGVQSLS